eukprot:2111436-Amphidinium_carterae.1
MAVDTDAVKGERTQAEELIEAWKQEKGKQSREAKVAAAAAAFRDFVPIQGQQQRRMKSATNRPQASHASTAPQPSHAGRVHRDLGKRAKPVPPMIAIDPPTDDVSYTEVAQVGKQHS